MSWWGHTYLPDLLALSLSLEPQTAPASEEELLLEWAQEELSIEQMLADPKDRAEYEAWLDERDRDVSEASEPK